MIEKQDSIHPIPPESIDNEDYFLGFGDDMEDIKEFLKKDELLRKLCEQYNIDYNEVFLRRNKDGKIMLYPSVKIVEWFKDNYSAYFSKEFLEKLESEINNSIFPDLKTILVQANFYDNINFELNENDNLRDLIEFFSLPYDLILFGFVNGKKTLKAINNSELIKRIEAEYDINMKDFSYNKDTTLEEILVYAKKQVELKNSFSDISDDDEILDKKDEELKKKLDSLLLKLDIDSPKDYTILPDLLLQATGLKNFTSSEIIPYGEYLSEKHSDFYWNTDEYIAYIIMSINQNLDKKISNIKNSYDLSVLLRTINRVNIFLEYVKKDTNNKLKDSIEKFSVDDVIEIFEKFDDIEKQKFIDLLNEDISSHYLGKDIIEEINSLSHSDVDDSVDDNDIDYTLVDEDLSTLIAANRNLHLLDIIKKMLSEYDPILNVKDRKFSKAIIIETLYANFHNEGYSRDDLEEIIDYLYYIDTEGKVLNDEVKTDIYDIFNKNPEEDLYDSLMYYYNTCGVDAWEKLSEYILQLFLNQVEKAMIISMRDFEMINLKFSSFVEDTKMYLSKDFIEKLPNEIRKDYIKNSDSPVIKKQPKKGKVFGIKKRFKPQTRFKITKVLYSTIAGIGIISFLVMTIGRFKSPSTSAEDCIATFKNMLRSDLLANIFGDIKTYFASLAASVTGTIGYIVQDEKESKTKTK